MVNIGNSWDKMLEGEFDKEYYKKLRGMLAREYREYTVYPDMYDIFNALKYTPYENVRAVILGQDPYHGPGQAHGLCFSVKRGVPSPPSLQNIFKELHDDLGCPIPSHGELTSWARQGVLLLNTVLTVRQGRPNSHRPLGWKIFTDRVIELLDAAPQPIVFLLWGGNAKAKRSLLANPDHLVLTAAHPSPLSAYNGFFGCRHFSKANDFLASRGAEPIDWKIE
ncbi:MAG: uracil-DNA glycosylase [Clostridia bacterium]|nr:uracil-DNA glycosylase [Clostridia bacterium]